MVVIDSRSGKNGDRWVFEDVVAAFPPLQHKSFNAHTKVTVEEIFYIAAAAPGVISTDVMVIGAKHGVAFTSALHDVQKPKIRGVLGIGESIRAPEIHIPFEIAVLFGTRRQRDLFHFFSGIFSGIGNVSVIPEPCGHGRFGFGAFAAEEPGKSNKYISYR